MKYCLSNNLNKEYLKKADEIRCKNLDEILELYELNPQATIILRILSDTDKNLIDWQKIQNYNKMLKENLIIETNSFDIMNACKQINVKFFYCIPVNNFYDLKALVDFGSYYAKIDAPLTHMRDKSKQYKIKIRMTPNIAYYGYIPRENGIIGFWVRPEDVSYYEPYIDVFEFEDCDIKKEQALYRIYAEQKEWPGDLNNLITNLNYSSSNPLIPSDITISKITCGQKCLKGYNCHSCYNGLNIGNYEKLKEYFANKES